MRPNHFFSRRPLDYWALWVVTLALLVFNGFLVYGILYARTQAARATADAAGVIGELRASSIDTSLTVDHEIVVDDTIPFETTIQAPIRTTIPIDTVVSIPVEFPVVGTRVIRVPLQTTIPVDLTIDVPVDVDVPIHMAVPVNLEVPVRVAFTETQFGDALGEVETMLWGLSSQLGGR